MQPFVSQPEKKESRSTSSESHPYSIQHIKLHNPEYKNEVPKHLQNKDLPGFPSTICAVGRPGSGKSNVLLNFLTRKELWNGFFDRIYLLGPTIESDKLFKKIKIPDEQKVSDPEQFLVKLQEWTEEQVNRVKHDPDTAPKCLFIFEDITAYRQSIQNDPRFVKCFTTIRHHKASAYANIHKFAALERTARLQCMHVMVWPVNKTDIDHIYEDYGSSDLDKHDFRIMCKFAWTPDEKNEKPFLYINLYAPEKERFRKCFTDIINVSMFDGMHQVRNKKRKARLEQSTNSLPLPDFDDPTYQPIRKKQQQEQQPEPSPQSQPQANQGPTRSARDSVFPYLH